MFPLIKRCPLFFRVSHYYVLAFGWLVFVSWNVFWAYYSDRQPGELFTEIITFVTSTKTISTGRHLVNGSPMMTLKIDYPYSFLFSKYYFNSRIF